MLHKTARRYRFAISATTTMYVSHRFAYCIAHAVLRMRKLACRSRCTYVYRYVYVHIRSCMRMREGRETCVRRVHA